MITVTIADILQDRIESTLGHLIYVVRDETVIFYVGQSRRDVVARFHEHWQTPSRLGQVAQANQPDSLQWVVDFYTLSDCRPFIQQQTLFPMQEWERFDMDMAESAMIRRLRPVINRDFNPHPTPLPPRYRGHELLGQSRSANVPPRHRNWLNRMQLQGWTHVRDKETGDIIWQHASGVTLTDGEIAPFRESGTLPSLPGKNS